MNRQLPDTAINALATGAVAGIVLMLLFARRGQLEIAVYPALIATVCMIAYLTDRLLTPYP